MKEQRKYYQLIPEKVQQNFEVIEALIKPEIKGYSSDCLREVISIICCNLRKDQESCPEL